VPETEATRNGGYCESEWIAELSLSGKTWCWRAPCTARRQRHSLRKFASEIGDADVRGLSDRI
jgi:hypothetical protein